MKNRPCSIAPFSMIMFAFVILTSVGAHGQESLEDIIERFNQYVAEGNYPKAIAELDWARRAIEKENNARIVTYFPEQLAGLVGDQVEHQQVLGINTHTRRYEGSEGSMEVTLTYGENNGAYSALNQLAQMFGAEINAEPIRIDGRTATLVKSTNDGEALLTVKLESGAALKMTDSSGNSERLLQAAREFGIKNLDDYLGGHNPASKSSI
ncbi:MAG: hypothetical protein DHS20C01_15210 [marine bacterium B5-7]|nr:MAG: hypothetical protein DHS20C01_15210 [marine bacterium B5-7]